MNIGLIGCGDIARAHTHHIAQYKNQHTIVAVCDTDCRRSQAFAKEFGIQGVYADVDSLLKEHSLDIAHVLTPPQIHAALAITLMDAGCNVLVEKPMAVCAREADGMLEAAKRNAVALCINHNLLFEPVVIEGWKLLRQGFLGKLISVDVHYGFNIAEASSRGWVDDLPGGMLQNLAPHPLCLVLDLINDPTALHISTLRTGMLGSDSPDEVRVVLEGKDVIGTVAISLGINPNVHFVRLCGTKAIVHIDLASKILWTERLRPLPRTMARGLMNLECCSQIAVGTFMNVLKIVTGQLRSYQGLGNLIRAFYDSIERGSATPIPPQAARRVQDVFDRICAQI